jgi:phosphonopyruvate decarboxylase
MHLGGLATIGALAPAGLRHVVLNNAAHDSVGGQPTVAQQVDLCAIARACGYREVHRADDETALRAALAELGEGPVLLEVRVRKGARPDLGRPTLSTQRAREQFSEFLRK